MRDAFLIFLLVLALAALGGFGWFTVWLLRAAFSGGKEPGCGLCIVLGAIGFAAIWLACTLLGIVGHATGVDMTQLTGG